MQEKQLIMTQTAGLEISPAKTFEFVVKWQQSGVWQDKTSYN